MSRRKRRSYSQEFKDEAVALTKQSAKSAAQIARDLDVPESVLQQWVNQAAGVSPGNTGSMDAEERAELCRLREENRVLRMERDFLKKAAAFVAKETK